MKVNVPAISRKFAGTTRTPRIGAINVLIHSSPKSRNPDFDRLGGSAIPTMVCRPIVILAQPKLVQTLWHRAHGHHRAILGVARPMPSFQNVAHVAHDRSMDGCQASGKGTSCSFSRSRANSTTPSGKRDACLATMYSAVCSGKPSSTRALNPFVSVEPSVHSIRDW